MNSAQLLPALRDLYSRLPEMYYRQPWELQHVLYSLGYTDALADEPPQEITPMQGQKQDCITTVDTPFTVGNGSMPITPNWVENSMWGLPLLLSQS